MLSPKRCIPLSTLSIFVFVRTRSKWIHIILYFKKMQREDREGGGQTLETVLGKDIHI